MDLAKKPFNSTIAYKYITNIFHLKITPTIYSWITSLNHSTRKSSTFFNSSICLRISCFSCWTEVSCPLTRHSKEASEYFTKNIRFLLIRYKA